MRTAKTVGSKTTVYVYNDGKLMREFAGDYSYYLDFFYDADGRPFALKYNGTNYYYILNLQGDVIRLIDGNGITVAAYEYDPYGKIISATGSMASINPLRYRGYYYDNETQLYYCLSRYYDPQTGRFISADSYASTGQGILGHNMYAYCNNNPVNSQDSHGDFGVLATLGMIAVGGLVGVAAQFISGVVNNAINGETGADLFRNTGSAGDYVAAFVSGAVTAIPGGGALASFVCNVGAPALQQGTDYLVSRLNNDSTDDYYWNTGKYITDVAGNFVLDAALSKVSMDMPQFVRDIKDDARAAGHKGTKALNKYLMGQQAFVFSYNQALGIVGDLAHTVYSGSIQKLFAA